MTNHEFTRLSVNMNAETTEQLHRLAYDKDLSYTEVVRRAITIMTFLQNETDAGRIVQVVDKDRNEVRELVIV